LIELVILACLAGHPSDCRTERLPFEGPMTACALHGQFVVEAWVSAHPNWRPVRWRCGPAERAI